jgi:hypothetical protein
MLAPLCKFSKLLIINMAEILYRIEPTDCKPSSLRLSFGNKKGVLNNNNNNNNMLADKSTCYLHTFHI